MSDAEPRYRLVLDLARSVTARRDLEDVLSATFTGLRQLFSFAGGSIQLLDDDGWIRMAATEPAAPADVLALRIPLGSTVGGRVILTERPVYVSDVWADPTIPEDRRKAHFSPGGVRSYYGVPLLADGRAIGLIQIDSPDPDAWTEEERLLLLSIGPIVAAAIQNAKAYAMHAEAQRHAVALEERQRAVDEAVRSIMERELGAVRALLRAARGDGAVFVQERLEAAAAQVEVLSEVLLGLLTPEAAAELERAAAEVPAEAAPQAAPGPQPVTMGTSRVAPAPRSGEAAVAADAGPPLSTTG